MAILACRVGLAHDLVGIGLSQKLSQGSARWRRTHRNSATIGGRAWRAGPKVFPIHGSVQFRGLAPCPAER
jgi:hypothetical protein